MSIRDSEKAYLIFGIAGVGDAHLDLLAHVCEVLEDVHWLMYANSVKSAKDAGASLRYRFSCIKTKGIG